MLDKVTRIAWLFDFYGPLLTERQRNIVELYFHQDYSLAEIAALSDVSRQAVHDILKRAEASLQEFEASLGFLAKYLKQQQLAKEIELLLKEATLEEELATQVKGLLVSLLEVHQEI